MIRVGRIGFANCTPLFMALEAGSAGAGVEFVRGVPTELNHLLDTGGIDLSPSSSVAYLQDPENLGFLPDLSISSIGPVGSVILFSDLPLKELGSAKVGMTPSSATSVILLRILLERFEGVIPEYGEPDEECAAVLQIGDAALRMAKTSSHRFVFDLGKLWFEATGTPFVFALWIARRASFTKDPEGLRDFYRSLVAARQRAYRSYAEYARTAPEAKWLGTKELLEYWGTISYDLTAWHMAGLKRFAQEAVAIDAVPAVPNLEPLPLG